MNWPKNLPGGLSSYGRTMMPVNHPVPIISLVYFVQPFSLLLDLHCIRTQNNKVCTTKFSFNRNCKQILAIKNMYKWSHRKVHSLKCERRTSSHLHQCHCLCQNWNQEQNCWISMDQPAILALIMPILSQTISFENVARTLPGMYVYYLL